MSCLSSTLVEASPGPGTEERSAGPGVAHLTGLLGWIGLGAGSGAGRQTTWQTRGILSGRRVIVKKLSLVAFQTGWLNHWEELLEF